MPSGTSRYYALEGQVHTTRSTRGFDFEGIAVGAFVDDKKSGRYLNAPFFTGLTLKQAVEKAEREFDSPYDK